MNINVKSTYSYLFCNISFISCRLNKSHDEQVQVFDVISSDKNALRTTKENQEKTIYSLGIKIEEHEKVIAEKSKSWLLFIKIKEHEKIIAVKIKFDFDLRTWTKSLFYQRNRSPIPFILKGM